MEFPCQKTMVTDFRITKQSDSYGEGTYDAMVVRKGMLYGMRYRLSPLRIEVTSLPHVIGNLSNESKTTQFKVDVFVREYDYFALWSPTYCKDSDRIFFILSGHRDGTQIGIIDGYVLDNDNADGNVLLYDVPVDHNLSKIICHNSILYYLIITSEGRDTIDIAVSRSKVAEEALRTAPTVVLKTKWNKDYSVDFHVDGGSPAMVRVVAYKSRHSHWKVFDVEDAYDNPCLPNPFIQSKSCCGSSKCRNVCALIDRTHFLSFVRGSKIRIYADDGDNLLRDVIMTRPLELGYKDYVKEIFSVEPNKVVVWVDNGTEYEYHYGYQYDGDDSGYAVHYHTLYCFSLK